jgi:hypothetical protein
VPGLPIYKNSADKKQQEIRNGAIQFNAIALPYANSMLLNSLYTTQMVEKQYVYIFSLDNYNWCMTYTTTATNHEEPIFTFRVLVELDSGYNVYIARCLETGSVATAADPDTVENMIEELLVDELTYALQYENLPNLYSAPAPFDTWKRFRDAQRGGVPAKPVQHAVRGRNSEEVSTEIKVVSRFRKAS